MGPGEVQIAEPFEEGEGIWNGLTGMTGLISTATPEGATVSFTYDANGDLVRKDIGSALWTYRYDYEDRLVEGTRDGVVQATYAYDALGRRIKALESGATTYTMYRGIASMYAWTATSETDHVYGAGLLIAKVTNGGATVQYVHGDALGSIRLVTDYRPARVFETHYRPFGQEYGTTGSDPAFRFTGERKDASSGLYYLHRRHYDPDPGRFLQADPVLGSLGQPQTLKRCAYVTNNPLAYVDPTGLKGGCV